VEKGLKKRRGIRKMGLVKAILYSNADNFVCRSYSSFSCSRMACQGTLTPSGARQSTERWTRIKWTKTRNKQIKDNHHLFTVYVVGNSTSRAIFYAKLRGMYTRTLLFARRLWEVNKGNERSSLSDVLAKYCFSASEAKAGRQEPPPFFFSCEIIGAF